MARSKRLKKEEISEIWCFKCKHGGELRLCDNTRCLKVYHPECVDKDESFLAAKTKWICNWHFCGVCRKASKFYCFCCPSAVCKTCLYDIQFALVKENKGFCNSCLELAWLIETKKDVNYDGFDRSDAGERNRFYFKGYWQKIKEKESLTPENVISAYYLLKKGEMHKLVSNTFASYEEEHNLSLCWNKKRKRSNRKTSGKKEKSSRSYYMRVRWYLEMQKMLKLHARTLQEQNNKNTMVACRNHTQEALVKAMQLHVTCHWNMWNLYLRNHHLQGLLNTMEFLPTCHQNDHCYQMRFQK
ncbi:hypothetical protein CISIN_1g045234mg [Citrus sinensis]|uniref:Zinc finger PHD-type domain-containing protein n=1 Tax=Citrus sinensis TaxID=2711 RepID=A0A067DXE1_CITSI|nr:hypothetical protein CISIN_1g045234mg [Citrus sinensis]